MTDITNKDRAEWAEDTLNHFSRFGGNDSNETFTLTVDLLANLQHLHDREEIDFLEAMRLSTVHYEAEVEEAEEFTEEQEIQAASLVKEIAAFEAPGHGSLEASTLILEDLIEKARKIRDLEGA